MTKLRHVLVKAKDGVFYQCQPDSAGWVCGKCLRGRLVPIPKKGDQCRVCKNKVAQVIEDSGFILSVWPVTERNLA